MALPPPLTPSPPSVPRRNSHSLPDFVHLYQNKLPLTIEVQTGHMGESEHATLSQFDKLNIHFVKHTRVALATILLVNHTIPINSALEFSLLYNPNGNITEAMKGFTFKTMGDLLGAHPPPKFVCCMKAWKNDIFSVVERELLVIKGYDGPWKSTCNVWSITFSTPKVLSLDCEGHFTTNPSFLHLYLSDYIQLVPSFFPCEVCVYTQKSNVRNHIGNLPQNLIGKVIDLNSETTETTLVASSAILGCNKAKLMEIPIDIPEVRIAVIESTDKQQMKQPYDPCHIREMYNPRNVQYMKPTRTEEDYGIQYHLYATIRQGFETDGISLASSSQVQEFEDLIRKMEDLQNSIQCVQKKVVLIDVLKDQFEELDLMLKKVQDLMRMTQHPQDESTILERNRSYLSKLTSNEVADLLKAMKLQQYVGSFAKERIDGHLMLELDDSILQRDLNVGSGLHRIRLLKIISGQHSAKRMLEEEILH